MSEVQAPQHIGSGPIKSTAPFASSQAKQAANVNAPMNITMQEPTTQPTSAEEGKLKMQGIPGMELDLAPFNESEDRLMDGRVRIKVVGKSVAALMQGFAENLAFNLRGRYGIGGQGAITGTHPPYPVDAQTLARLPNPVKDCKWIKEVFVTTA